MAFTDKKKQKIFKADETEWNNLPVSLKERIKESIQQANDGKFILNDDAVAYIRKKYAAIA